MGILIFNSVQDELSRVIDICSSDIIKKVTLTESDASTRDDEKQVLILRLRVLLQENAISTTYSLAEVTTSDEEEIAEVRNKAKQVVALMAGDIDVLDFAESGLDFGSDASEEPAEAAKEAAKEEPFTGSSEAAAKPKTSRAKKTPAKAAAKDEEAPTS